MIFVVNILFCLYILLLFWLLFANIHNFILLVLTKTLIAFVDSCSGGENGTGVKMNPFSAHH